MAYICEQREHFTDIFRLIKDARIRKGSFYTVKIKQNNGETKHSDENKLFKITIAIRFLDDFVVHSGTE